MLTTWALEGRIGTLRRPDAAADRAIYALTANILIGIVLGVVLLRSMVRRSRGGYLVRSSTISPSVARSIRLKWQHC